MSIGWKRATALCWVWGLLLIAVGHGIPAFLCYFTNEHRRLAWPEIAVMWMGDVLSLVWLLKYTAYAIAARDQPETMEPTDPQRLMSELTRIGVALAISLAAEFSMTMWMRWDEYLGFQRAQRAQLTVTGIQASQLKPGEVAFWLVDGEYQDVAGKSYVTRYYIRDRDDLLKLNPAIIAQIRQRQLPLQITVVYDPRRPTRNWVPELGWDDGNRIHYVSLLVLVFQFFFGAIFLQLAFAAAKMSRHELPWWWELHPVIPITAEAFILGLFAVIEFWLIRRFCP
jgi:sterol desaturase/sphingolipid hydroxylase (fatty acid hydroxylase superfamily)